MYPLRNAGLLVQYTFGLGVIAVVTLCGFLITPILGAHATALVFLLTVVLLALALERGPTLLMAALSALLWDFFFLPPVYAFRITHFEDAMLFGLYFVIALVLGHLTSQIRAQQGAEREREARATALYLLTRDLNESVDLYQMIERVTQQIQSCFRAASALLLPDINGKLVRQNGSTIPILHSEQDLPEWVFTHRQRASRATKECPLATTLFIPLLTTSGPVGVLALALADSLGLTAQQENLLDTFCQQIAMAVDRHRLSTISEKSRLLVESERLSKTLLDCMSHEIRTPLAAIQSAVGNLAQAPESDRDFVREMLREINEATSRLNRLVGNVLEASRLESGTIKPRFNECDIGELIHVVVAETEKELRSHPVTVALPAKLPVICMDFVLMQQALKNLLSNSVLHTPPGTPVELRASIEERSLVLVVADKGPGIPHESLPRVFDKFYRVPNSRTGGTGLGLSLVKGFVEAQGGRVVAENLVGGGVSFTIRLPQMALIPQPAISRQ